MARRLEYSEADLAQALKACGVGDREFVFSHVGIGRLGRLNTGGGLKETCEALESAFATVMGGSGTWIVPVYTNSFGNGEVFDRQKSPSTVGEFTEYLRLRPHAVRSREPMLSVVAVGPRAHEILDGLSNRSFGPGSIHERLLDVDALICNVGVNIYYATFRHHSERAAGVPFRFDKYFSGTIRDGGKEEEVEWIVNSRILQSNCNTDPSRIHETIRNSNMSQVAPVGFSEIAAIGCRDFHDFLLRELGRTPWLTAEGPPLESDEILQREKKRIGIEAATATESHDTETVCSESGRWALGQQSEDCITALAQRHHLRISTIPSGTNWGDTIVPELWAFQSCTLHSRQTGRKIPVHPVPYSRSFSGTLSGSQLKAMRRNASAESVWTFADGLSRRRATEIYCDDTLEDADEYQLELSASSGFGAMVIGDSQGASTDDLPGVWVCLCVSGTTWGGPPMMDIDALLDSLLTSRGGCAADYRILLLSSIHGLGVEIQKRNPGRTVRCLILRDTGSTDREFRDFARQHACHVEDVYSTEELMGELAQTEASVNPEAAG